MLLRRTPTDANACLLVQARTDPEAFVDFYDAYYQRVLVFFTRRVYDAEMAFDLMSETFARAFQKRASFRGATPEEEQGWLFTIARNQLTDFRRRGSYERRAIEQFKLEVPVLTTADIERIEELAEVESLAGEIREAMSALPEDQATAVTMRVVDGLGYDQIAARLNTTQQVIRARVSRGLRALARSVEPPIEEGAG